MKLIHIFTGFVFAWIVFCTGAIAFGGWQGDQKSDTTGTQQSPFSLDTGTVASPAKPLQRLGTKAESGSPFALPSKDIKQPTIPATPSNSPFALPPVNEGGDFADKAFEEDNRSAAELLEEGMRLARTGKLDEARIALARSVRMEPENVAALNNLGLVLRKLGKVDDALKSYQYALQVDNTYALTYKNLGVLLEKKGEKERAAQAYMEYCRLAPGAKDIPNVKARAEWLQKNL